MTNEHIQRLPDNPRIPDETRRRLRQVHEGLLSAVPHERPTEGPSALSLNDSEQPTKEHEGEKDHEDVHSVTTRKAREHKRSRALVEG